MQFSKSRLQLATVQAELTHAAVPLAAEHALPQLPQLVSVILRSVSHPLPALPSQLPKLAAHVDTPQTPATQFGVPIMAEQTVPHMLQLLTSVAVLISQPLVRRPSQFA